MIEQFTITITPFNRERTERVYVPNNYGESKKAYSVLYMHDGQNLFRDEDASFWGVMGNR
ncbi:alpha/beta hydrolase-fold protein [Bacillus sp. DJP31]|uniref:alpha/beta hydrolase-fold protein n=1 Tax=Bacillus sp. DJP31 TaxID=3409789 RepID=UPI003BB5DD85